MSDMNRTSSVVLAATATAGQAIVTSGGTEATVAGIAGEDNFIGFADYDGEAGDVIRISRDGEVGFIAGELFTAADDNATLKLGADGTLVKTDGAAQAYVARYAHKEIMGGQGGDPDLGTESNVTAGNFGRCFIERGVTV